LYGAGGEGQQLPQLIILVSLAVVIAAYLLLSRQEGNFVNVLTPVLLFTVPALYLLVLIYGSVFGYEASLFAYFYCFLTYALGVVGTLIGYLMMPAKVIPIFVRTPRISVPGAPFVVLAMGVLLYAPILIRFPGLIFSPRQIYELTRSGFGIHFYLSSFAVYFGMILLFFSPKARLASISVFVLVSLILLYLHGSKGQVLNLLLIALYFLVFVKGRHFNLARLAGLGAVFGSVILGLFYLGYSEEARKDLLIEIAGYAEYTRNAAMVIDDATLDPQMGRLAAESKIFVIVPRAVFPDKPKDYGAFWLAKRYFPDRFELDVGAPDFGLGLLYADFGVFAVVYYFVSAFLAGVVMKVLVTRLRRQPDPGTFLLLLVFLDVGVIPTGGGGVPLIFFYGLAYAANCLAPRPSKDVHHPQSSAWPSDTGNSVMA
jgi:hypothetical protein